MATITSSTGASGLAIDSIVTGLMNVERQPLTKIQSQVSSFNTKLSAYGTLKSGLSTFQTAVDKLSTAAKFNAQTANLSDSTSLTASADGTAASGNYTISVSQLASAQKLATNAYSNTSDIVGTGTLTISFGKLNPATTTPMAAASFTDNAAKTPITLTIDNTNNTLAGIRDAINAKGAPVSASIVNDGTGNRLVLTSKDTGEVNSLKVSVTDSDGVATDSSGLSSLAYDPLAAAGSGQNMTQLVAARNALLNVDGLNISQPTNTLTGVIQGVTMSLKAISTTPTTLTVETDTKTIEASVQEFVDAYNKLNTSLRNLTRFVEGGSSANGPLLGDSTARDISVRLRSMLTRPSQTASTFNTLSDIGVSIGADSTLSLNSARLKTAMSTNLADVAKLFSPSATSTDPQVNFVSNTKNTVSGTYALTVSQLGSSTQDAVGSFDGVAANAVGATLTGAAGGNSAGLKVSVAGTATGSRGTVTFNRGLAGELSSMIGDWLESDGILAAKTDGINASIKTLNKRREAVNDKLPAIEARYRAQYSRLDALLSGMQSTSSFLSQQISALNNSR